MSKKLFLFLAVATILVKGIFGQVDAKLMQHPDVSETQICFIYGGDIWVVDKEGGLAKKLSSPKGTEAFPRFSPDGKHIAFSGNYDGNTDVYIIPSQGGIPKRITYHPGTDRLVNWSPDGEELLFASRRESGRSRFNQLYHISRKGGQAQKYPVPYGEFAALAPDQNTLAYMPKTRDFRTWKRYRGGGTSEIWLFNLENYESKNITKDEAIDAHPMWHGKYIYFLSDRGNHQRHNIWRYNSETEDYKKITDFTEFDITFPAIGGGDIVFEAGGDIYLLNLENEEYRQVNINATTDLARVMPRQITVDKRFHNPTISYDAKRIIGEARGDLFSVPAEKGYTQNLTQTSGVAEIKPAYSPDGSRLAFWSDQDGEYDLYIKNMKNYKTSKAIDFDKGFRYQLFWAPDGEKLAFIDNQQYIHIYNLESEQLSKIDREIDRTHPALAGFQLNWSSDSKWITYSKQLPKGQTAIFAYNLAEEQVHQLTSGFYNDSAPVFDPDNQYLYYLSKRDLDPVYSSIDATWIYPNTTRIIAVPLSDSIPSPLAPKNDSLAIQKEDTSDKKEKPEADKKDPEEEKLNIETENFESRMVILPPKAGRYSHLAAVKGKILYIKHSPSGSDSRQSPLKYFDLDEKEEKTILDDADDFTITASGEKLLVRKSGKLYIVGIAEKQKLDKAVPVENLKMDLDPRSEWTQMFHEVWRKYRDFFYDPNMHGVNWQAMRKQYSALLQDAVDRSDVNFITGNLIAELNSSHTYVFGGDMERGERENIGLLGADFILDNGAYKIDKIIEPAPWDQEVRSPLAESGVNVEEGDYILAVNGKKIDPNKEPWAAFTGLANETVVLTVNDSPEMEGARQIIVKTLATERRLRNLAWINKNRKYVEKLSEGKLGYIYMPNTSTSGQTELIRQFYGQFDKQGFIIDERFNSGGQLAHRFVELLSRPIVHYISRRNGPNWQIPEQAHEGPKVMLINGWSVSGGDAFPYTFKSQNIGPIVGTRTAGGLIGPATGHGLIDGGIFTVPGGRIFSVDEEWFPESHGVEPDIKVIDDPTKLAKGEDPQIKRAVEKALQMLKENPPREVEHPAFEDMTSDKNN
ncbi:MAG TPA: PDZ domain-containing protein [bacterium]|nr:PDZ domain-containing protein [bacterium]